MLSIDKEAYKYEFESVTEPSVLFRIHHEVDVQFHSYFCKTSSPTFYIFFISIFFRVWQWLFAFKQATILQITFSKWRDLTTSNKQTLTTKWTFATKTLFLMSSWWKDRWLKPSKTTTKGMVVSHCLNGDWCNGPFNYMTWNVNCHSAIDATTCLKLDSCKTLKFQVGEISDLFFIVDLIQFLLPRLRDFPWEMLRLIKLLMIQLFKH